MTTRLRFVLAAGTLAAVGLSFTGPACAGATPHLMTGHWLGFFQSVGDPDLRGPASFEVTTQDQRRFTATFTAGGMSCVLDGTISASMIVSATGGCGDRGHLVLQGPVSDADAAGGINPCIFNGRWVLNGLAGVQQGSLGLLHLQGGPTELATGEYTGTNTWAGFPPDPCRADLFTVAGDDRMTRHGAGTVMVGDTSFDVVFDIAFRPDSTTHGFALVGSGESGILLFNGTFQPPPDGDRPATISAHATLEMPGGDEREGEVSLQMSPGAVIAPGQ